MDWYISHWESEWICMWRQIWEKCKNGEKRVTCSSTNYNESKTSVLCSMTMQCKTSIPNVPRDFVNTATATTASVFVSSHHNNYDNNLVLDFSLCICKRVLASLSTKPKRILLVSVCYAGKACDKIGGKRGSSKFRLMSNSFLKFLRLFKVLDQNKAQMESQGDMLFKGMSSIFTQISFSNLWVCVWQKKIKVWFVICYILIG